MTQVSSIQFYSTLSVYRIVYSPSEVKSPSITIDLPFTTFYVPLTPVPFILTIWVGVKVSLSFYRHLLND